MQQVDYSQKYLSKYRALLRFPNLIGSQATYQILESNYEDLRKVIEDDRSYCAISVFVPSEILHALRIHYLPLEPVIATASQLGVVTDFQDIREDIFVFDTSCCGGQSLLSLYKRKILPLPKFLISCSHMCDDSLKTFNFIAKYFDLPIFNIDIPYSVDENSVTYVAAQLEELVEFISTQEDVVLDLDCLRDTVAVSNRTNDQRQQVFTYCRENPPVLKMSAFLPAYPLYTKFGSSRVEDTYRDLADEIQLLIKEQVWTFQDGCYRVLWMGMIPLTFPRFFGFLDSLKLGFPITELMLHSDFEEMEVDNPFKGVANKLVNFPLVGGTHRRIDKIQKAVKDFDIEGIIHFNHRGCISFNGDNFIFADYFRKNDIPFLILSGDIADKDYCSEKKLQEGILNFHNILETKHGKR